MHAYYNNKLGQFLYQFTTHSFILLPTPWTFSYKPIQDTALECDVWTLQYLRQSQNKIQGPHKPSPICFKCAHYTKHAAGNQFSPKMNSCSVPGSINTFKVTHLARVFCVHEWWLCTFATAVPWTENWLLSTKKNAVLKFVPPSLLFVIIIFCKKKKKKKNGVFVPAFSDFCAYSRSFADSTLFLVLVVSTPYLCALIPPQFNADLAFSTPFSASSLFWLFNSLVSDLNDCNVQPSSWKTSVAIAR